MLKAIEKNKRFFIVLSVVGGVYLLFFLFGILPKINEVSRLSSVLSEAEKRLGGAEPSPEMTVIFAKQLLKVQKEIDRFNELFLKEKKLSSILKELNDEAQRSGVEVSSIEPSSASRFRSRGRKVPEIEAKKCYCRTIRIKVTGGYADIAGYLRNLEGNLSVFFTVDDLQITGSPERPEELGADLQITIYFLEKSE